MNGVKEDLERRLDDAVRAHCWRTACARKRDIARYEQEQHGTPYEETLLRYNYDYYTKSKK